MNALSEHWNSQRLKTVFHAANHSRLRYPLLILTLLLLAAVMISARQLAAGILADVQVAFDSMQPPL